VAETLIGELRRLPFAEYRNRKGQRQVRRPTKNLAVLLEPLLVKYHIGRDSPEHTLRERWAELVGGANAAYSHPVEIDPRGRLLVLTSHAIVRNELFLHRDSVLQKIRAIPGCDHIKTLQLRAG
jgi:hypothetical protein